MSRVLREELKRHDVYDNTHDTFGLGSIEEATICTSVTQGVDSDKRIGDSIQVKRLLITGELGLPPQQSIDLQDFDVNDGIARLVVVLDKQPNTNAGIDDIFRPNADGNVNCYAHTQVNSEERFVFLEDKTILLPVACVAETVVVEGSNFAATNRTLRPFRIDLDLNIPVMYADDGSVLYNNILFCALNNYMDLCTIRYYTCLYFVDD